MRERLGPGGRYPRSGHVPAVQSRGPDLSPRAGDCTSGAHARPQTDRAPEAPGSRPDCGDGLREPRRSALLQPRQRGRHRAGPLQPLLRHPADHLGPAGGEDAQPAAHREPQEPAVQLDADLLVLVLRHDVLEEQHAEVPHVRLRPRRDGVHRARRQRQLEIRVHRLPGLERRFPLDGVEAELARHVGEPDAHLRGLLQRRCGAPRGLAGLEEPPQLDLGTLGSRRDALCHAAQARSPASREQQPSAAPRPREAYTAAPMTPREVAQTLREISQLLQIKGENAFKVRAYDLGADAFDALPGDPGAPGGLYERVKNGTLTELGGIGKAISEKVTELVNNGRLRYLDDLRKEFPLGALNLMRIPGLGPRKAAILIRELDVGNLADLERACREHRVRGLRGFGEKTEQQILQSLQALQANQQRQPLYETRRVAEKLLDRVRSAPGVTRAEIAGSVRRYMETNADVDLVAAAADPAPV